MKAWQRQEDERRAALAREAWEAEKLARALRIENETATLVQGIHASGNPNNPKTRRQMRALERLTGQKALTVVNTTITQHPVNETWDWRIEFSDGQIRSGWRFSKAAAESDVRRVIQDMTGR